MIVVAPRWTATQLFSYDIYKKLNCVDFSNNEKSILFQKSLEINFKVIERKIYYVIISMKYEVGNF